MEITNRRLHIIRGVQEFCADLAETDSWTTEDAEFIANFINQDEDPWGLFRHMDERTGASDVGYKTKDGREWFYILRQMRNQPSSGLLENLGK